MFLRLRPKDIGLAIGIAVLNLAVTVAMGLLVSKLFGANANPLFVAMGDETTGQLVLFALKTIP